MIVSFPFCMYFFPTLLITFSILIFFVCFLQCFFIKCPNNFFTIKIFNNICPWNCILNFFDYKTFFRPIWSMLLCKNGFVFWYYKMTLAWNLGSLSLNASIYESIYVLSLTSIASSYLFYDMYFSIYLLYHLIY